MTVPLPWPGPQFDASSLCAETDPELFYPEVGGSNVVAKRLCGRCENQDACLTWALENGELDWGIFGGKSPAERRRIAADRAGKQSRRGAPLKPIDHGTEAGMRAHQRRGDAVPESDPCGCRAAARLAGAEREQKRRAA